MHLELTGRSGPDIDWKAFKAGVPLTELSVGIYFGNLEALRSYKFDRVVTSNGSRKAEILPNLRFECGDFQGCYLDFMDSPGFRGPCLIFRGEPMQFIGLDRIVYFAVPLPSEVKFLEIGPGSVPPMLPGDQPNLRLAD